jgi:hypothetical protein
VPPHKRQLDDGLDGKHIGRIGCSPAECPTYVPGGWVCEVRQHERDEHERGVRGVEPGHEAHERKRERDGRAALALQLACQILPLPV